MTQTSQEFWESCWRLGANTDYNAYLQSYYKKQDPIIDLFKKHRIQRVCDAACGFGAYSLMLSSNGFQVEGFDIAPTSVGVTKALLQRYGIDTSRFKVASVLDTGYRQGFDAVTAISVLDHLYVADAGKALAELLRIVHIGGIVVVSFDSMDADDLDKPHKVTKDGSILYSSGMVFHHYSDAELKTWLGQYSILMSYTNDRGERFFAIEKT